jgi:hypothetical protein
MKNHSMGIISECCRAKQAQNSTIFDSERLPWLAQTEKNVITTIWFRVFSLQ